MADGMAKGIQTDWSMDERGRYNATGLDNHSPSVYYEAPCLLA